MSLHSLKTPEFSRRTCLQWAAAAAMMPMIARAGTNCPCAEEVKDDHPAGPPQPAASTLKELRVCADPNNLPCSNRNPWGFEDKIAAVVARDLGLPLDFDWLPQRLGFYRTALKTFDSNL